MKNLLGWFHGIKGKLLVLAVFPVIMLGGVSYIALQSIAGLSSQLHEAGEVRAPKIRYIGEMDSARNGIFRWLWAAYITDPANVSTRQKLLDKVSAELFRFEEARKKYVALPRTEAARQIFSRVESDWPKAMQIAEEARSLLGKDNEKDNRVIKEMLTERLRPILEPIATAFQDLNKLTEQQISEAIEVNKKAVQEIRLLLMTVSSSSSILLLVLSLFFASYLAERLGFLTGKISEAGTQVSTASTQLSSASQQLSAGASEAAASLEETVSSLEQLSSMVKLNSEHAREASTLSNTGKKSAEEGETEIRQLMDAMRDISQSSKKIEEIINVIDDIAFQTNILALNAAVEAARAGEQGKGFAVVAEAVRNLAQRSGEAAKEIAILIKDSVSKVENGSSIANRSGAALNQIVASIKKVADLNNEISSASQEQSTGLEQISKAMNQLDLATQGNASSAEEVAASSEEMSAQAIALRGMVEDLAMLVHGSRLETVLVSPTHGKGETVGTSARFNASVSQLKHFKDRKGEIRTIKSVHDQNKARVNAESVFPLEGTENVWKQG